jgi:hypothetical protein
VSRRRAALAIVVAGLAACSASDVYLNVAADFESGVDFVLVGWNLVPFALPAAILLVSRVSIPASALATLLMAALVLFAFWGEASDLNSADPSSTGEIVLIVSPFWDVLVIGIVCGVDAVVRQAIGNRRAS